MGTQLILLPTALLWVHTVIIVARWGTLRRPAGNQRTLVGGGQVVSHKVKSVKVFQEPGVEQDSIENEYPLYCLADAGHSKLINVKVVVDRKPLTCMQ